LAYFYNLLLADPSNLSAEQRVEENQYRSCGIQHQQQHTMSRPQALHASTHQTMVTAGHANAATTAARQDHLVPKPCHIISQHIKQLGSVCVAVHCPSMPLQLRLHLPQSCFAALVACFCPFQLLLLGLHFTNQTRQVGHTTCKHGVYHLAAAQHTPALFEVPSLRHAATRNLHQTCPS
jgi:hypothetical protein